VNIQVKVRVRLCRFAGESEFYLERKISSRLRMQQVGYHQIIPMLFVTAVLIEQKQNLEIVYTSINP
jgi:hypothetical protein